MVGALVDWTRDEARLSQLRSAAEGAVREAMELVQQAAGRPMEKRRKEGQGSQASEVLTDTDLRSQELLQRSLQKASQDLPCAWLGEESADSGERHLLPAFWCVDPLDGTLRFVEGQPGYMVSVALVRQDGVSLIGVVGNPCTGELFSAQRGKGAWRNGVPWKIAMAGARTLRMYYDRSFAQHPRFAESFVWLQHAAHSHGLSGVECIYAGGSVYHALLMVESTPAVFFKYPRLQPGGGFLWDYAATACLVEEAGGYVSDIHGLALPLNHRDGSSMYRCGFVYASSAAWGETVVRMYRELNAQS